MEEKFAKNDLYEYKVEAIRDDRSGYLSPIVLQNVLNAYSSKGWRLRSTMVNELGKQSSTVGYGGMSSSTNATIEETILIFERRIRTAREIDEINREMREKEQLRIEKERKLQEKERQLREKQREELNSLVDNILSDTTSDELVALYRKVPDKRNVIYNVVKMFDKPVSAAEVRSKFNDQVDLMEVATFLTSLVDTGKLIKDEDKKYSIK